MDGDGMKTAAILPTPGDTFVSRYWARNYAAVWRGEVDELLVFVNGGTPDAVRAFEDVGARVIFEDRRVGHGEALGRLVRETTADVLVFMEDDAFVRRPGAIAAHLMLAEQGEVIGSPRGGMSPELEVAALAKWGPVVGPDTSTGHGLWPCFFFARRDLLAETDCRFESQNWPDGSRVPGLDFRVHPGPLHTDTMTSVAFQLRARHHITPVVQWKEVHLKENIPADAPWFHAGGLSTLDEQIPPGLSGSNGGRDFAHRLWWWLRTANGDLSRTDTVRVKAERAGLEPDLALWDGIIPASITWSES